MKIVTIVGARPQFIKAAAVSRALRRAGVERGRRAHRPALRREHVGRVLRGTGACAAPDHHLGIGSGPHGEQTGRMLEAIEQVLLQEQPDWMLVYGDTNSTLAGALAAAKLHIPVAHVEAGLRSFNRRMPEEINRVAADHVSALLFAADAGRPSTTCASEGIAGDDDPPRRRRDVRCAAPVFEFGRAPQPDPRSARA